MKKKAVVLLFLFWQFGLCVNLLTLNSEIIIQLLRLCGVQGDGIWAPRALEYCPKIDMNVPA